jgi:hypothetical protein
MRVPTDSEVIVLPAPHLTHRAPSDRAAP